MKRAIAGLLVSVFISVGAQAGTIRSEGLTSGAFTLDTAVLSHTGTAASFYGLVNDDFTGTSPIRKADLNKQAANLFFVDSSIDGLTLFVVYYGDSQVPGIPAAAGNLDASAGDFVVTDYLVGDGPPDLYTVFAGDMGTSHRLDDPTKTDGYVARLGSLLDSAGEMLTFQLNSPIGGQALNTMQVYTTDGTWTVLEAGEFRPGRRVRFSIPQSVPAPSAAFAGAAFLLALGIARRIRR